MLQLGNVQLFVDEMMRLGVDICGLSEVRWNGQGHFTTLDGHTIVFIGKSLKHLWDMNQSATESLLCDSTQNHETLL